MKNRFIAGFLALFLGTFGVQKFYLGRRKEGVLCAVAFKTGFPTLLGLFEGLWILTRKEEQWKHYLEAIGSPKWYEEPEVLKQYLYPVGIYGYIIGIGDLSRPVFQLAPILLFVAIWLYPGDGERILENRIRRAGKYIGRLTATAIFAGSLVTGIAKVEPLSV